MKHRNGTLGDGETPLLRRDQNGMAEGRALCECPTFTEENKERLDAEYEAQKYEDMRSRYE